VFKGRKDDATPDARRRGASTFPQEILVAAPFARGGG
jgi:hypothetical protein